MIWGSRQGVVRTLAMGLVCLIAILIAVGCRREAVSGFPHRAHLELKECGAAGQPECPTCLTCHEGIRQVQPSPRPASPCARCHAPTTPPFEAASASAETIGLGRAIRFSHSQHLTLSAIGGQCVTCHSGVATDGVAGHRFPSKPACMPCHNDELYGDKCSMCHGSADLSRMIPSSFLRHDEAFARNHGLSATQHAKVCSQCHAQAYCTGCHDTSQTLAIEVRRPDAIERNFVHRADYVTRHAIEANADSARCLRCHEVQTCNSCHVQRGVSANRIGSTNPHPIGWLGPDTGSATFHGKAARRDIVACAACHDQGPATNCIQCHKVGGTGGKPHPSGWSSSRSQGSAMCRYCHGH